MVERARKSRRSVLTSSPPSSGPVGGRRGTSCRPPRPRGPRAPPAGTWRAGPRSRRGSERRAPCCRGAPPSSRPGPRRDAASGPWQASQRIAAWRPPFIASGHVGVALDARGAPCEGDGSRSVLLQRPGPVVAVDAEALRDEKGLQDEEGQHPGQEQPRHPEQVTLVPEEHSHDAHPSRSWSADSRPRRTRTVQKARTAQGARSGCDDRKKRPPGQEPNGSCRRIKLPKSRPAGPSRRVPLSLGLIRGER